MEKMRGHIGEAIEPFKDNARGWSLQCEGNSTSRFYGRPVRYVECMKKNMHRHSGHQRREYRTF